MKTAKIYRHAKKYIINVEWEEGKHPRDGSGRFGEGGGGGGGAGHAGTEEKKPSVRDRIAELTAGAKTQVALDSLVSRGVLKTLMSEYPDQKEEIMYEWAGRRLRRRKILNMTIRKQIRRKRSRSADMLRVEPAYFVPVESAMLRFLYDQFFAPILAVIEVPLPKLNANSALIAALRSGRVQYNTGVFSGAFSAAISRDLSVFATFDKRSGTWKGKPGADVLGVAVIAKAKRDNLVKTLRSKLDELSSSVDAAIKTLGLGAHLPIDAMSDDIDDSFFSVGVTPTLTPGAKAKLRADYTDSQQLNIKNWAPEQIVRLREMVERIQTTSDNSSIRALIQSEWGTTAAKAKFLARQETSLFFSTLSMNQAQSTGIRRYRWSTSHDERVRVSHVHLDGTIQMMGFPPVVDPKTGRRAAPGQDFNCRCAPIWILD